MYSCFCFYTQIFKYMNTSGTDKQVLFCSTKNGRRQVLEERGLCGCAPVAGRSSVQEGQGVGAGSSLLWRSRGAGQVSTDKGCSGQEKNVLSLRCVRRTWGCSSVKPQEGPPRPQAGGKPALPSASCLCRSHRSFPSGIGVSPAARGCASTHHVQFLSALHSHAFPGAQG